MAGFLSDLFKSPQAKEKEKLDRQRRIQYLKRKYAKEPSFRPKRKSEEEE